MTRRIVLQRGRRALWLGSAAVAMAAGSVLARGWLNAATGGALALAALLYAWQRIRSARSPLGMARSGFIAAALALAPGEIYLSRDAHLIFRRDRIARWLPFLQIIRFSEDDFEQLCREGSAIIGAVSYRVILGTAKVVIRNDADRPFFAAAKGYAKAALARPLHAGPEELRELTEQIAAAENLERKSS